MSIIRSIAFSLIGLCSLNADLSAQNFPEPRIGLTLQAAPNLRPFGQTCGPFTCRPDQGFVFSGGRAQIVAHGFPGTRFFIGISAARNRCLPLPGIAGALVLSPPAVIYAIGRIPPGPFSGRCPEGQARIPLSIPKSLPLGSSFIIQSLGESQVSPLGPIFLSFSSPIQATVR